MKRDEKRTVSGKSRDDFTNVKRVVAPEQVGPKNRNSKKRDLGNDGGAGGGR